MKNTKLDCVVGIIVGFICITPRNLLLQPQSPLFF